MGRKILSFPLGLSSTTSNDMQTESFALLNVLQMQNSELQAGSCQNVYK